MTDTLPDASASTTSASDAARLEPFETSFPSSQKVHDRVEWNGHELLVPKRRIHRIEIANHGFGRQPKPVARVRAAICCNQNGGMRQQMADRSLAWRARTHQRHPPRR